MSSTSYSGSIVWPSGLDSNQNYEILFHNGNGSQDDLSAKVDDSDNVVVECRGDDMDALYGNWDHHQPTSSFHARAARWHQPSDEQVELLDGILRDHVSSEDDEPINRDAFHSKAARW